MEREINLSEISDGKKYKSNDMVKCGTSDCNGCFDCCCNMGDSIILDPYDIYTIAKGTGKGFSELLHNDFISLHLVDGVILPNIKMQKSTNACIFLNSMGRCSIHPYRPGYCRLFPLGRIYENNSFSYFLQINECKKSGNLKIKIKKWLDIPKLNEYEKYILIWHDHLNDFRKELNASKEDEKSKLTVMFLKHYYEKEYNTEESFYLQFYKRYDELMQQY